MILNPKISIVMQVYLGDYPGSRKNSTDKFIRAIDSFLNQSYSNSELVIVSDGCGITHNLYLEKYKLEPRIKYAYVSKNGMPNMYDLVGDQKYYRGIPRQVGVTITTGDLITYMDSDDILLPNYLDLVVKYITLINLQNPDSNLDFYANTAWFDSADHRWPEGSATYSTENAETYKFKQVSGEWVISQVKQGMIVMAPWLFIHKKKSDIDWKDTTGTSEDVDFNVRFRKSYKNGAQINAPGYIRCHYSNLWDY